jgi:hypothetical protein
MPRHIHPQNEAQRQQRSRNKCDHPIVFGQSVPGLDHHEKHHQVAKDQDSIAHKPRVGDGV